MLSVFCRQYGKLPDCSGALRRNNHCHSKFICCAITVHFREVVRHLSSETFSYTLITAALWPFVCLLKSLFPICMEICRRLMHLQGRPNRKQRKYENGKVTQKSIVSVLKQYTLHMGPVVLYHVWTRMDLVQTKMHWYYSVSNNFWKSNSNPVCKVGQGISKL